ncbi:MAG: hypothetical protein JO122_15730 [Acetobacteraceae bacterium]|nr:hypothetical protein [Acetobacteraceae bacterium]
MELPHVAAVSRMSTPAMEPETGSSRAVVSGAQPPDSMRWWEKVKGHLTLGNLP